MEKSKHSETDIEKLLLRLVPNLAAEWEGATPDEIQKIRGIAGQDLPLFYLWFLSKMGRQTGRLSEWFGSYTVSEILMGLESEEFDSEPPLLLIGQTPGEISHGTHGGVYYDLTQQVRNDAKVLVRDKMWSETLREYLAETVLRHFIIKGAAQRAFGTFQGEPGEVTKTLRPLMAELGFTCPIETGPFCLLYERRDVTLIAKSSGENKTDHFEYSVGGANNNVVQSLFQDIAKRCPFKVVPYPEDIARHLVC